MKGTFDLISQNSKKYVNPQKVTISVQKSNNFGTEFDRVAIAIAGTPLKSTPRDSPLPPYEYSNGTTHHDQIENQAMIIENPLADFENIKLN
uniref:Uncharacterized protein n=1 Tax=Panagrolaimus sp. JU765 TaxID=591449 RepID=A0AC34QCK1_9BILA